MTEEPERYSIPRTPDETRQLIAYKPTAWEYRLFAGILAQGKEQLETKWRDYEIGYVRPTGKAVTDQEAWDFLAASMNDAQIYLENITRTLSPKAIESALGPPGTPGDPVLIQHMAERVIASYEELLDRAARLRGTRTSDHFKKLFELAAVFTNKPLHQIRDFIDVVVNKIESIPELLKNAQGQKTTLNLDLTVSLEQEVEQQFHEETQRVGRQLGLV
jgi:hypothetical protein